jgi:hypothetical protein
VSQFLQWGIVLITIPNLIVVGLMIVIFALGVAFALPEHKQEG